MEKRPVAYQVYSAREDAARDFSGTLKAIRAMGYDGVEFAGLYGHTAHDVRAMLDEVGIQAISSHVPLDLIKQNMFGVISDHLTLGTRFIAVPYLDNATRPGAPGFAPTLRLIARFGAMCHEAGIKLLYHNHDFEFIKLSGLYGLDFIYEAIGADVLQTEIDVCWVKYAGENPADYIRKYAGRCPVVHLKDYVGVKGGTVPYGLIGQGEVKPEAAAFEFRPVGHGCQDVRAVVEAGIESGAEWFVVEQDQSVGRTPLEAARMSLDTLRALGL